MQPGDVGEGAQADQQCERLVDAEPQRPGDRARVVEVDVAVAPLGLDQVVGHVARRAADEEQLEVLDQLLLGDPELRRGGGQRDALAAGEVGHHREQPGEALRRAGAGPSGHRPTSAVAAVTARTDRNRRSTASRTSSGAMTRTSGPKPVTSSASTSASM